MILYGLYFMQYEPFRNGVVLVGRGVGLPCVLCKSV